jgi:dihydrofolate reductase
VRRLKAQAERDMAVAGPELAAQAIGAGLVDELQLLVAPVVIGGGKQALPDGVSLGLDLLDQRRFGGGMTYLRYGITGALRGERRGD